VVQDPLHRALRAALHQALEMQLVLLLQQRMRHALHLPSTRGSQGPDTGVPLCASGLAQDRAELSSQDFSSG
jgi:hypothetical protein